MKYRLFSIIAATAFALTACEISEPDSIRKPDQVEEPELSTFVFSSEEDGTRTVHEGHTVLWSAGDAIRMAYTVGGAWQGASGNASSGNPAKFYASDALLDGGRTAEFSVPGRFTGSQTGTYQFYTIYPASATEENFSSAPSASVTIPMQQTPLATSFDPAADLLLGHSIRTYNSKPTESIPLMWDRLVAHADITLKELTSIEGFSADETIRSVTLTAQSGAHLTGTYNLNVTTGALTPTAASNSVTILPDYLAFNNGTLECWAAILPVQITSLTVTLDTDAASYTRTISSCDATFPVNARRKLGINMSTATRTPYYVKVTEAQTDWSGNYLIVYEAGDLAFDGSLTSTLYRNNGFDVTITDGRIQWSEETAKKQFTIAKTSNDYYSIKSASGYYIGNTRNSTYLNADLSTVYNSTISFTTDGSVDIVSEGGAHLRYINSSSVSSTYNRFCYVNTTYYQDCPVIHLYKLSGSGGGTPDPGPGPGPTPSGLPGYLGCYEMPEVSYTGGPYSGNERWNIEGTTDYGYEFTQWSRFDLSSTRKIITHTYKYNNRVYRNLTAVVDRDKRCPVLTCYAMHNGAYPRNNIGRLGSFNEETSYDPGIPTDWQSSGSTSDYYQDYGNYARGHHCASYDRQANATANYETFYYTNQSPQKHEGFNNGVWEDLEKDVRSNTPYASSRDTLYVVVGTLFEDGNYGSSNDGGTVARPSHFYKCLMKCSFNSSGTMTGAQGIAYIFTNEVHTGYYDDSEYVTTIDAIELRSGFNLFANVPEDLQTTAESTATPLW